MFLLTSSMFYVNEKAENQQTPDLITHRHASTRIDTHRHASTRIDTHLHASTRIDTHRIALGFSGALFTFLDDTIIAP